MQSSRAQTSTEYLIILAVVVIIALIAVGVLGGIPGVGQSGESKTTQAYWASAEIGIDSWAVADDGDVTLVLKNNKPKSVKITEISLDGEQILSDNETLEIGDKSTVTGSLSSGGTANTNYEYDVSITYQDLKTGSVYVFDGIKGLTGFFAAGLGSAAGSHSWFVDSEAEFDSGTYTNTESESSGIVKLGSGQSSGTYLSDIKDSNSTSTTWDSISWGELLPYGEVPSSLNGDVVWLHLDEASGTLADSSGHGNSGTNNGATYGAAGKFNDALSFDGADDYVSISDSSSIRLNGDFSFSAFVKANKLEDWQGLLNAESSETWYSWTLRIEGNNNRFQLAVSYGSSSWRGATASSDITTGQWYHVAGTWDNSSGTGKLYVNGVEADSFTDSLGRKAHDEGITLGYNLGGTGWANYFNGTIDEVAVWNRTLSANEIENICKRGLLNLKAGARACSQADCSDGSWTSAYTDSGSNSLSLSGRYFQFNHTFETDDTTHTPELDNVTVGYTTS